MVVGLERCHDGVNDGTDWNFGAGRRLFVERAIDGAGGDPVKLAMLLLLVAEAMHELLLGGFGGSIMPEMQAFWHLLRGSISNASTDRDEMAAAHQQLVKGTVDIEKSGAMEGDGRLPFLKARNFPEGGSYFLEEATGRAAADSVNNSINRSNAIP